MVTLSQSNNHISFPALTNLQTWRLNHQTNIHRSKMQTSSAAAHSITSEKITFYFSFTSFSATGIPFPHPSSMSSSMSPTAASLKDTDQKKLIGITIFQLRLQVSCQSWVHKINQHNWESIIVWSMNSNWIAPSNNSVIFQADRSIKTQTLTQLFTRLRWKGAFLIFPPQDLFFPSF